MKMTLSFLLSFQLAFFLVCAQSPDERRIASIRVYNPTASAETRMAEVPVGSLATPELVDWQNIRLQYNGKDIPFSIREGKPHWKAALRTPVKTPGAEDVLVFPVSVPPRTWMEVEMVKGRQGAVSALSREGGNMIITYPGLKAVIDERSGMLTGLVAFGDSLLDKPMHTRFFKVGEGAVDHEGRMGPGYQQPSVTVKEMNEVETSTDLVSWSSTGALTELNFVLRHTDKIAVGLTYRIYPNNELEIILEERPWKGRSPWLAFGLENRLEIAGMQEKLNGFQTYFPYYGFKDYAASVKSVGLLHEGPGSVTFELGEESVNGRFWKRRLAIFPLKALEGKEEILDALDEGLVVKAVPFYSAPLPAETTVAYPAEAQEIGQIIVDGLKDAGIRIREASDKKNKSAYAISLNLSEENLRRGILGDGFKILPSKKGIEIFAVTRFGLFKGAESFMRLFRTSGNRKMAPLISSNPAVDLRAGGFGGGPFEVDFPYGNEKEWKHALNGMMSSGMNIMTTLGMWSNWKMPTTFKYMPELRTDDREAYDEVSGAKFSLIDSSREFGLRLLNYLHTYGVKVWLWVPVGAIPTTFSEKYPEATVPGKSKVPRFMHPEYRRYLESYFRELLETYPVDGFVLIRDDNGGIDDTEEFKEYIAQSKTKDPVWEQYMVINQLLRRLKFEGKVAVYPYFDGYEPAIQDLIPEDIVIVGHGSGMGVLTRNFENLGTMGDTWLDNVFAGFRVPPAGRMKRLLSDRGSYWIGGAYNGTELPWEAIGYFGWQPSASVNTFRYDFGTRNFGEESAVDFVAFDHASGNLWEIMNVWLLPHCWMRLPDSTRQRVVERGQQWLEKYRQDLQALRDNYKGTGRDKWFAHEELYATYFDYHLQRAALAAGMEEIALSDTAAAEDGLPRRLREQMINMNEKMYALAQAYDKQAAGVASNMISATRSHKLTLPFKEFVYGYDASLDRLLKIKQFDAQLNASPGKISAGKPFEITVEIRNTGFMPWTQEAGQELILKGKLKELGLPEKWSFTGDPMVFGDRRVIVLHGTAPSQPGAAEIRIDFLSPVHGSPIAGQTLQLKW